MIRIEIPQYMDETKNAATQETDSNVTDSVKPKKTLKLKEKIR